MARPVYSAVFLPMTHLSPDVGRALREDHDTMPYVELPGVHLWYNDSGGNGVPGMRELTPVTAEP